MELSDGRLGNLIETERLAALVARRVAIAVGDEGFHRLCCKAACRLDWMNVNVVLFNLTDGYIIDLHSRKLLPASTALALREQPIRAPGLAVPR